MNTRMLRISFQYFKSWPQKNYSHIVCQLVYFIEFWSEAFVFIQIFSHKTQKKKNSIKTQFSTYEDKNQYVELKIYITFIAAIKKIKERISVYFKLALKVFINKFILNIS